MAIIRAWGALHDELCPDCGRPLAVHIGDKPANYSAGFYTCPASQAKDAAQAEWRNANEQLHKTQRDKGLNPEAGIRWFTFTAAEGQPTTDEDGVIWS